MNRFVLSTALVAGAMLVLTGCGSGGQAGGSVAAPTQPQTGAPATKADSVTRGEAGASQPPATPSQSGTPAAGTPAAPQQGSSLTQAATAKVDTSVKVTDALNPPLGQDPKDQPLNPLLRATVNTDLRNKKATSGSQELWAIAPKENANALLQVLLNTKVRPAEGKDRFYVEAQAGFLKPGDDNLTKYQDGNKFDQAYFQTAFTILYVVEKDGNSWKLVNSNAKKLF